MTRDEAIAAMDAKARVRIGRIKSPDNPLFNDGVIEAIYGKHLVSFVDDSNFSCLVTTRSVRLVNPRKDKEAAALSRSAA